MAGFSAPGEPILVSADETRMKTTMVNPDSPGEHLPILDDGGGLRLRPLVDGDAGAVFELFGDPGVVRFMSVRRLESEAEARDFIVGIRESFLSGTLYQWGIELERELVGTCTLAGIDREHRRAELGFAVLRRRWGRGVASRALPAVIDFAFERLGLHRLEADADPRNEASLRVLERLGFRREGLLRERYFQEGEAQDAVVFGLLRREWRERLTREALASADAGRLIDHEQVEEWLDSLGSPDSKPVPHSGNGPAPDPRPDPIC
jgi:RimJ/RimL family protein N-acetyltransferase